MNIFFSENVTYGLNKFFKKKFNNPISTNKYLSTVEINVKFFLNLYKGFSFPVMNNIVDKMYAVGIFDGYSSKKSEELTELILTPPYNRISKN